MGTKDKKTRYTGDLAKPIPWRSALVNAFLNTKERRAAIERDLLLLLLKHYDIEIPNRDQWRALALCLAREHVPAFRISDKRGRPRGRGGKVLARQKVGRPATREYLGGLIYEWCEDWKKKTGVTGRGSGKKAIEALLEEHVKNTGRSRRDVFARGLKKFQKIYSEARKRNRGVNSRNP